MERAETLAGCANFSDPDRPDSSIRDPSTAPSHNISGESQPQNGLFQSTPGDSGPSQQTSEVSAPENPPLQIPSTTPMETPVIGNPSGNRSQTRSENPSRHTLENPSANRSQNPLGNPPENPLIDPSENPSTLSPSETSLDKDRPRVLILGAGIAGLVAAHRLQSTGRFDVVILEASHRVGGRVYTSTFRGKRVEFGAQWIHGIKGSPVYKLAKEASLMDDEPSLMEGEGESDSDEEEVDFDEMLADISVTRTESGGLVEKSLRREVGRFYRKLHEAAETKGAFRPGGVESVGEFLDWGFEEWLQSEGSESERQRGEESLLGEIKPEGKPLKEEWLQTEESESDKQRGEESVLGETQSERENQPVKAATESFKFEGARGKKAEGVSLGGAEKEGKEEPVKKDATGRIQSVEQPGDRKTDSKPNELGGSEGSSNSSTEASRILTQPPKKGGGPGVPDSAVSNPTAPVDTDPNLGGNATSNSPQALRTLKRAVFEMRKRLECNIAGTADLRLLSLQAYPDYLEFPGAQLQIPPGYSGVAEALCRKLSPETVRFGQEVRCVRWDSAETDIADQSIDDRTIADRTVPDRTGPGRTIAGRIADVIPMGELLIGALDGLSMAEEKSQEQSEKKSEKKSEEKSEKQSEKKSEKKRTGEVVVECCGGDTWQTDHVIVTVSLGVLKERAAAAPPCDAWGADPSGHVLVSQGHVGENRTQIDGSGYQSAGENSEKIDGLGSENAGIGTSGAPVATKIGFGQDEEGSLPEAASPGGESGGTGGTGGVGGVGGVTGCRTGGRGEMGGTTDGTTEGIGGMRGETGGKTGGMGARGFQPGTSLFDPPLPREKQAAIRRMGFGAVDKVFVEFEKQPLPRGCGSLELAWTSDGSVATSPATPDWTRGLFSLGTPNGLPKSLMCWVHGQHALRMETLSPTEIARDIVGTIERFQGGRPVPASFDVARSDWVTNPLFRGSYSYVAVGSSEDDIYELARPLPYGKDDRHKLRNGSNHGGEQGVEGESGPEVGRKMGDVGAGLSGLRVLFAGEATHPHYYSTTHGAWLSGLREAERLIEMHNVEASDLGGLKRVAFGTSSIEEELRQGKVC